MMNRGGLVISSAALLAVAGCATDTGKLEVRAKGSPLAEGTRPVPFRIAEARGQLAIGNVALALESFRKAQRENPASVDALVGLAECYERMGRFDLSRRHYEEALANAPADTGLLEAFAESLDRQGNRTEAASIRREIAARLAAASPDPAVEPVPGVAEIRVELPSPTGIGVEQTKAIVVATPEAAPQPTRVEDPVQSAIAVAQKATAAVPTLHVAVAAAEVAFEPPQSAPAVAPPQETAAPVEPARSVTIKLPAPRPAPSQAAARVAAVSKGSKSDRKGPRLERLSMGEVALVTVPGPRWWAEPISNGTRSATVRFVPLQPSQATAEIRLLNAARVHRLAARTRAYLRGRGWRDIAIGDADSTRARSIVYYPERQRLLATKLSKQFGFVMAPHHDYQEVTVLLGRDSVGIAGARAGA